MGLFAFLFGKQKKTEHSFFGSMLFQEDKKNPLRSYFECRRHFFPAAKEIEIGIDGSESGPTEIQVEFFQSIEENYDKISLSLTPLIEEEFRNWKEGFRIIDFRKEFEAVYLRLPRCESQPVEWEIAFESDHDRNHTFTATMSDFEVKALLIDG